MRSVLDSPFSPSTGGFLMQKQLGLVSGVEHVLLCKVPGSILSPTERGWEECHDVLCFGLSYVSTRSNC